VRRSRVVHAALAVALAAVSGIVAAGCAGASSASAAPDSGCATSSHAIAAPGPNAKPRSLAPGDHEVTFTLQHFDRCFVLYVPPNPPVKDRPLVLVYHGATDTADSTRSTTDFQEVASQTGEVVAFLQGYTDTWNDGAGATDANKLHVNDVAYTMKAIAAIQRLTPYDHKRVVAAGFSNGALMVQYLGCEIANRLEMIVPVEGEMAIITEKACKPSRPVSLYEVHGTADSAIPYWGGTFTGVDGAVITVLSAPKSTGKWASLDHCASLPTTSRPSSSIELMAYSHCRQDRRVVLRTIFGGVHQWTPDIASLIATHLPPP